ncbi:hypothetical protein O1L55_37870 [Streptomyces albulus]|nr:hypothetical protein [Streptomyces noursei]
MDQPSRSPVATGPERVFSDLRAVAARVRDRLSWEEPESAVALPAEERAAGGSPSAPGRSAPGCCWPAPAA